MKCPYPDCNGQITPGEQFCGECGRSLAPEAVAAALSTQTPGSAAAWPPPGVPAEQPIMPPGGPAAYGLPGSGAPPATPPGGAFVPPPDSQAALGPTMPPPGLGAYGAPPPPGLGAYGAPPAGPPAYGPTAPLPGAPPPMVLGGAMPMAPPARRGFNPLWLLVGGIGAVILVCIGCVALFIALPSSSSTPTPTVVVQQLATPTAGLAVAITAGTGDGLPATPIAGVLETPTETDEILYTHTEFDNYTDASGTLVVFGTVHNISDGALENIKVTADLRDSNDKVIGSGDDTYLTVMVIGRDQVVPFLVRIPGVNDAGDKIHISVESEPYDPSGSLSFTPAQNLTVTGDTLNGTAGSQTVSGRIQNGDTVGVTLARALVIGYDAGGTVADVAEGFVSDNTIPAGGAGTFIAQFSREDTTIVKYDVTVFGSEQP